MPVTSKSHLFDEKLECSTSRPTSTHITMNRPRPSRRRGGSKPASKGSRKRKETLETPSSSIEDTSAIEFSASVSDFEDLLHSGDPLQGEEIARALQSLRSSLYRASATATDVVLVAQRDILLAIQDSLAPRLASRDDPLGTPGRPRAAVARAVAEFAAFVGMHVAQLLADAPTSTTAGLRGKASNSRKLPPAALPGASPRELLALCGDLPAECALAQADVIFTLVTHGVKGQKHLHDLVSRWLHCETDASSPHTLATLKYVVDHIADSQKHIATSTSTFITSLLGDARHQALVLTLADCILTTTQILLPPTPSVSLQGSPTTGLLLPVARKVGIRTAGAMFEHHSLLGMAGDGAPGVLAGALVKLALEDKDHTVRALAADVVTSEAALAHLSDELVVATLRAFTSSVMAKLRRQASGPKSMAAQVKGLMHISNLLTCCWSRPLMVMAENSRGRALKEQYLIIAQDVSQVCATLLKEALAQGMEGINLTVGAGGRKRATPAFEQAKTLACALLKSNHIPLDMVTFVKDLMEWLESPAVACSGSTMAPVNDDGAVTQRDDALALPVQHAVATILTARLQESATVDATTLGLASLFLQHFLWSRPPESIAGTSGGSGISDSFCSQVIAQVAGPRLQGFANEYIESRLGTSAESRCGGGAGDGDDVAAIVYILTSSCARSQHDAIFSSYDLFSALLGHLTELLDARDELRGGSVDQQWRRDRLEANLATLLTHVLCQLLQQRGESQASAVEARQAAANLLLDPNRAFSRENLQLPGLRFVLLCHGAKSSTLLMYQAVSDLLHHVFTCPEGSTPGKVCAVFSALRHVCRVCVEQIEARFAAPAKTSSVEEGNTAAAAGDDEDYMERTRQEEERQQKAQAHKRALVATDGGFLGCFLHMTETMAGDDHSPTSIRCEALRTLGEYCQCSDDLTRKWVPQFTHLAQDTTNDTQLRATAISVWSTVGPLHDADEQAIAGLVYEERLQQPGAEPRDDAVWVRTVALQCFTRLLAAHKTKRSSSHIICLAVADPEPAIRSLATRAIRWMYAQEAPTALIFEVAFSPCLPESTDRLGIATSMWELHMAREGTRSQLADEDAAGDAGSMDLPENVMRQALENKSDFAFEFLKVLPRSPGSVGELHRRLVQGHLRDTPRGQLSSLQLHLSNGRPNGERGPPETSEETCKRRGTSKKKNKKSRAVLARSGSTIDVDADGSGLTVEDKVKLCRDELVQLLRRATTARYSSRARSRGGMQVSRELEDTDDDEEDVSMGEEEGGAAHRGAGWSNGDCDSDDFESEVEERRGGSQLVVTKHRLSRSKGTKRRASTDAGQRGVNGEPNTATATVMAGGVTGEAAGGSGENVSSSLTLSLSGLRDGASALLLKNHHLGLGL